MDLRRLTSNGIEAMKRYLDGVRTGAPSVSRESILESADLAEPHESGAQLEKPPQWTRFSVARHLYSVCEGLRPEVTRDIGLWAFLALAWFEELARGKNEQVSVGALHRWVPSLDDAWRYYRHLLLGPYLVYQQHARTPEVAMALLCQPVSSPGEVVEQIASRQELVTSAAVVELVTDLYYEPASQKLKRGAGGKGDGSARRLGDVLMQLNRTYDLHASSAGELKGLLPAEFGRFQRKRWWS